MKRKRTLRDAGLLMDDLFDLSVRPHPPDISSGVAPAVSIPTAAKPEKGARETSDHEERPSRVAFPETDGRPAVEAVIRPLLEDNRTYERTTQKHWEAEVTHRRRSDAGKRGGRSRKAKNAVSDPDLSRELSRSARHKPGSISESGDLFGVPESFNESVSRGLIENDRNAYPAGPDPHIAREWLRKRDVVPVDEVELQKRLTAGKLPIAALPLFEAGHGRMTSLLKTRTHERLAKELKDLASRSARDAVECQSPEAPTAVPSEVQPVSKKRKSSQIFHSPRKAKKDWTYDLAEVMELFQVGRSTVYNWRKHGLKHVPVWPILFRGQDLNDFHRDRRQSARRSFAVGQFLCFFCKRVQSLIGHSAVFHWRNPKVGTLRWICPQCGNHNETYQSRTQGEILESSGVKLTYMEADYDARRFPGEIGQIDPIPEDLNEPEEPGVAAPIPEAPSR